MANKVQYPRATGRRAALLHAQIDSGLTRTEIASAAELSGAHYSRVVNGRLSVPLATAEKIAKAVKQSVSSLFTIDPGPSEPQLPLPKSSSSRGGNTGSSAAAVEPKP